MYAGFKLEALKIKNFTPSISTQERRLTKKKEMESRLKEYVVDNTTVNATEIQNDWFPQVKANVFLSHSHADIESVTLLADFLEEKFGLNCFIDSYVWGYFNNLINILFEGEELTIENVSYVSSNVHMMLSMALNNMIDRCECIIFYNTPNSLSLKGLIQQTTSPWIYNELTVSRIIRKRSKIAHRLLLENFSTGIIKTAKAVKKKFFYDVSLSHLHNMQVKQFNKWAYYVFQKELNGTDCLDCLYDLYEL